MLCLVWFHFGSNIKMTLGRVLLLQTRTSTNYRRCGRKPGLPAKESCRTCVFVSAVLSKLGGQKLWPKPSWPFSVKDCHSPRYNFIKLIFINFFFYCEGSCKGMFVHCAYDCSLIEYSWRCCLVSLTSYIEGLLISQTCHQGRREREKSDDLLMMLIV